MFKKSKILISQDTMCWLPFT